MGAAEVESAAAGCALSPQCYVASRRRLSPHCHRCSAGLCVGTDAISVDCCIGGRCAAFVIESSMWSPIAEVSMSQPFVLVLESFLGCPDSSCLRVGLCLARARAFVRCLFVRPVSRMATLSLLRHTRSRVHSLSCAPSNFVPVGDVGTGVLFVGNATLSPASFLLQIVVVMSNSIPSVLSSACPRCWLSSQLLALPRCLR